MKEWENIRSNSHLVSVASVFLPQFNASSSPLPTRVAFSSFSSFAHSFLERFSPIQLSYQVYPADYPESPLPPDTLLGLESLSIPSQLLEPLLDRRPKPKCTTHDYNSILSPRLPSGRHPLLILRCARDLFRHTTPQTAFITQHRLNAHKSNTIISTL